MPCELQPLNRRGFLRLTGAGTAATAISTLLPHTLFAQADETPLTDRPAPKNPVIVRSPQLEIALDREDGVPFSYRLTANGAILHGEDLGKQLGAIVCRKSPWQFSLLPVKATHATATQTSVVFAFETFAGNTSTASFTIRYELRDANLTITLEDITEAEGYELISVEIPRLLTVRESDPGAWLAHGDTGGSFITLDKAKLGALPPNQFWGPALGTLPILMLGTSSVMCVQETTAYMDGGFLSVIGPSGSRRAAIGSSKVHRVNGEACYDLNLPKDQPRNCGTSSTPNLLVEEKSSCRLDFLAVEANTAEPWLAGAKLVRDRMPKIPTTLYNDKYTYGIRCDEPLFPKPTATFDDCEKLIRDVHNLTDGAPQIVHLWGWQFKGKDTGYPAVNVVNERIGGYDRMMRLFETGPSLNAIVTLSDNYDDAYRSSPSWNEALVARRPDGQLWKSRAWTGEESYILGLAKYMEGPGVERIRYTCEHYKLRSTTHVDVLSYYAIRNDWDPTHPASGIRNLEAGRYRVLDEYRKRGIDVSSEALRYPMIGHISSFWYAQTPGTCPFGGDAIPLLPIIYRNSATWGYSGGSRADHSLERHHQLFYGACPHSILRGDIDRTQITDTWYLGLLPWFHLHALPIESFRREGDTVHIGMTPNAEITIDWAAKTYSVTLNGAEIATQDSISCPISPDKNPDKLAFYSLTVKTLRAPLPAGWNPNEIAAVTLSTETRTPTTFHVTNGTIEVTTAAQQPLLVYRNKSLAAAPYRGD
jgi:Endo-alpha-N-acetylgalactosaminidase